VTASYVSISSFKVQKSSNISIGNSCVMINSSIGDSLTNCPVRYGYFGIMLWGGYECTVSNVTISDSGAGLLVYDSGRSTVLGYQIISAGFGLTVSNSTGSTLRNNHIVNCSTGFSESGELVDFFNDIDTSNTIDGKPVYCLVNQTGLNVNPLDVS
jgi:parallel beta-helix repeat protein